MATPEPKEEKWSDLIDDLWENHLPYFRKKGYVVSSRPSSANSPSADVDPSSTILSELTRSESDQNILETLKKEVPPYQKQPVVCPRSPGELVTAGSHSSCVMMVWYEV